jgi:hypothetical protein
MARAAQSVKLFRYWTPARWFCSAPLFKGLPQDLENMTPALRQLIQQAHAMVRLRHLARPRHLASTDQPHIQHGLVGGARRAGGYDGCLPAGEPGGAEVMHAVYEGQRGSSRPGRFHPHCQRHQLMQIN